MIRIFKEFQRMALETKSFNRVFYENLEVDEQKERFGLRITEEMCDGSGKMHRAGIVAVFDGATNMFLLAKKEIFGVPVSVTMNTVFFEECFAGEMLFIAPEIVNYSCSERVGVVKAQATVEKKLIAEIMHTIFILQRDR
jgi:acyl-coenzyme A thioesterase PaaI-like protein